MSTLLSSGADRCLPVSFYSTTTYNNAATSDKTAKEFAPLTEKHGNVETTSVSKLE